MHSTFGPVRCDREDNFRVSFRAKNLGRFLNVILSYTDE